MSDDYGPWDPASLEQVQHLFAGAPFRWWLTGGLALECFAQLSWRNHADIDVGVCRSDTPLVYEWLSGKFLWIAGGSLTPWDGRTLDESAEENNVWMKNSFAGPWVLDLAIGAGNEQRWTYRRDKRIGRTWATTVLETSAGVPFLAPEIQLLFKSNDPRPKDEDDARHVIPVLDDEQCSWLREHLPAAHPWAGLLDAKTHFNSSSS